MLSPCLQVWKKPFVYLVEEFRQCNYNKQTPSDGMETVAGTYQISIEKNGIDLQKSSR